MKKLLLIPMLLLPVTVYATTYEWVDSNGSVNFTDDLGKVPKKFRKKAKIVGEETGEPQISEVREPAKAAATKASERPAEKKGLYGGRDEKAWRGDFARAKGELKLAEQDLTEMRGRLNDLSKMSRSDYLSLTKSLKLEENRVLAKRKRLEELNESADAAGVPADFRQ